MKFTLIVLLTIIAALGRVSCTLSPVVKTPSGNIVGQLINVAPGIDVYQFTGIPYAAPPVGSLRYRKPQPISSWGENTFYANVNPHSCPEYPRTQSVDIGDLNIPPIIPSEDCLLMNIFVPKRALKQRIANSKNFKALSVFAFIHGGTFNSGSLNNYNGSILAGFNDIITVFFQFRLGSLGYAYFGTSEVPGNMGLWDQAEALKWINENIGAFGGDNQNVTLAGFSSGAAMVTLHLLSNYTRSYFQRAIVESGSSLCSWGVNAVSEAQIVTEIVFEAVASMFCSQSGNLTRSSPVEDKVSCLRSVPAAVFPQVDQLPILQGYGIPFTPIIDGDFLPADPRSMLLAGNFYKVPLLIGGVSDEGSVNLLMFPGVTSILPVYINSNLSESKLNYTDYVRLLQISLGFLKAQTSMDYALVEEAALLHYWPRTHEGYPYGIEVATAASDVVGDYGIFCPTYFWAQLAARYVNVYAYYFNYRRQGSIAAKWIGAFHGSQLSYVTGHPFQSASENYNYTYTDKMLSRVVMAYWANFVKYGNPNGVTTNDMIVPQTHRQLLPWPMIANPSCPLLSFLSINPSTMLKRNADPYICGVKSLNCKFWGDFMPTLIETISKSG